MDNNFAEVRRQAGLSQAQLAQLMNVRQERIGAIERAEPGATEIRTLARYVAAAGGQLVIEAHVNGKRITLWA